MNIKKLTLLLILGLSILVGACQGEQTQPPDNSEGAGEAIEEAGEDAGEAIEDAGEDVEDEMEEEDDDDDDD